MGGLAVTLRLKPGSALFVPPYCVNRPTWRRPAQVMSLVFGNGRLDINLVNNDTPTQRGLKVRRYSEHWPLTGPLPRVLDAMLELHAAAGPAAALPDLAGALLCCLKNATSGKSEKAASPARSLLKNVCAYLQDHHQHEISRDMVARQFGISPNYLSRVFQVHGSVTFAGYLTQVRTAQAKQLLGLHRLKLDDVAAQCGYGDTAYFCRVFKRLAGLTPATYRARFGAPPEAEPGVYDER